MTRTIPAINTDCLKGRHHAHQIAEACAIAFWMHGRDEGTCAYQLNVVHKKFAELADALGYTITPIAASGDAAVRRAREMNAELPAATREVLAAKGMI